MELKLVQKDALAKFVRTLEISNGSLSDPVYEHSKAFERSILIADQWASLIGPREFQDILWDATWNAALGSSELTSGVEARLDDPQHTALFERVFNGIRTAFESLPRSYNVYIPLAGFPELGAAVLPIVAGIDLVDASFDDELTKRMAVVHPRIRSLAALHLMGASSSNEVVKTRYLRIAGKGYGNTSASSPVIRTALATAKHFIHLAMQEGAASLEPSWRRRWDDKAPEDRSAAMLLWTDNHGDTGRRIDVPSELMGFFHRVVFDSSKLKVREPGLTFLTANERAPVTPEEMSQAVLARLERTRQFLGLDPNFRDAKGLRSAMEWAIDADTSSNETIAFLQRCIAFEALLGSKEKSRGVSDRLADRYSFLLGRTESERDDERRRFLSMYEHRSEIVHGRAGRLSEKHRNAAFEAEIMLQAVIRRETSNLLEWLARRK